MDDKDLDSELRRLREGRLTRGEKVSMHAARVISIIVLVVGVLLFLTVGFCSGVGPYGTPY